MNVKKQRCIFVEPLSDSIHIALSRNNGFLHLFRDFLKSNAFSENLVRIKFILHEIFLWMSILSSSKTSRMFINLHWKVTLPDFQLIIIFTITIQLAVLNWFSWNSHGWYGSPTWVNPIFFLETVGPIELPIWGKMCP